MEKIEDKLNDKKFVNYHIIANLEKINQKLDQLIQLNSKKKEEREGIFR